MRSIGSWMCKAVCTGPAPSIARGLEHLGADVVERAVHDDDPAAGAGPERDDREDRPAGCPARPSARSSRSRRRCSTNGDRADRRVEHEQPQHDARGPGERARDVVDEPDARAEPAHAGSACTISASSTTKTSRLTSQNDQEQRDVPDGRARSGSRRRPWRSCRRRRSAPSLVKDEHEGVERGQHAEREQEQGVAADEDVAHPRLRARDGLAAGHPPPTL